VTKHHRLALLALGALALACGGSNDAAPGADVAIAVDGGASGGWSAAGGAKPGADGAVGTAGGSARDGALGSGGSINGGGGAAAGCPVSWPLADADARRAWMMTLLSDAAVSPFSANPTIRQYAFMALYLLGIKPGRTDADVALAKAHLTTAFQSQCADAGTCGSSYGLIRFHRDDAAYDYNSTTFTLQGLAPILAKYQDLFTASELAALRPNIDAALGALDTQGPSEPYTNIFLMRATDLVVIGEALLPLDAKYQHFIDRGYQLLDGWKTHTTSVGIDEFDSPSYYAADLDSLVIGYLHAKQKPRYQAMLDYFWADIAANFFPARGTLSGPHSRDYEFLSGDGASESFLYVAGWRSQTPADTSAFDPDLERVFTALNLLENGYQPSGAACAIAFAHPKMVTQTWGDKAKGYDRSNYVGTGFALGGVSHDYGYGPQEKVVTLELAEAGTVVSLVTEDDQTSDNPYGAKTQQGNFSKPFRLPSFPVVAQTAGLLLVTAYASPLASNAATTLLATNILLPPEATITRAGTTLSADTDLAVGDVIGIRVGQSAGAIRIWRADDCAAGPAVPKLKFEKSSATSSVDRVRIVVYQKSGSSAAGCAARVGLLVAGEDCGAGGCNSDAALAGTTITEALLPTWKVTAAVSGVTLAVERTDDFAAGTHAIVSRTANGQALATTPLEVDGKSIAPPL
jgi:hypothetical protein